MQAEAVRNYKPCDELSEQMSELKAHKREKGKEHVILRKENRSPKNVAKVRSTAPALSVTTPPGANTSSVSSRSSLNPVIPVFLHILEGPRQNQWEHASPSPML